MCLLKKALYGSPISGKGWHDEITEKIRTLGYERSVIDHCLFTKKVGRCTDLIVIYVDDLLVTSSGGREGRTDTVEEPLTDHGGRFAKRLGVYCIIRSGSRHNRVPESDERVTYQS